jgi:EpsI family protein
MDKVQGAPMSLWLKNLILLILMLAASGLALALRPTEKMAAQSQAIDLETIIPAKFGDWRQDTTPYVQIVDPQQQEVMDRIYTQTLNRTYSNASGYRIMLAIAYGDNQRDSMQMHYPEICYPAQGFALQAKEKGTLPTSNGPIPVTRILTSLGPRDEPVTYWTTIGDKVFQGGIQKKLAEMSYGLSGKIPDGMLIRISSIDPGTANAYEVQAQFAEQMLHALKPEYRKKLNGNLPTD